MFSNQQPGFRFSCRWQTLKGLDYCRCIGSEVPLIDDDDVKQVPAEAKGQFAMIVSLRGGRVAGL